MVVCELRNSGKIAMFSRHLPINFVESLTRVCCSGIESVPLLHLVFRPFARVKEYDKSAAKCYVFSGNVK